MQRYDKFSNEQIAFGVFLIFVGFLCEGAFRGERQSFALFGKGRDGHLIYKAAGNEAWSLARGGEKTACTC